jgi:hypothetical protein
MSKRKHNLHSPDGRLGDQITGPVLDSIVIHPRSRGRALGGGTLPPGSAGYPAVAHDQDLPLPRRTAGNAPGGARIPQNPQSADLRWKPPNPDLLRRLLAGLKRLG